MPPLAPRGLPPSNATASSQGRQGQQTLATIAFPPQLSEAEALAAFDGCPGTERQEASHGNSSSSFEPQVLGLRRWRDELLELLAAVARGVSTSASDEPVEEVWHWLVANERLTRSLAFAEHPAVTELSRRLLAEGGQEGGEAVCRWTDATKQLHKSQKETAWNAQYLRVVEEPLKQLASEEVFQNDALPSTVRRLLRSLARIFHSSDHFKEHRMASLLHKILKALVRKAGQHLPSPFEIAKPPGGFGASIRRAGQLEESFKAFVENFFICEPAASSNATASDGRRPATSTGTRADRSGASSARSSSAKRKDASSELGWWRATVRTSLQGAEHCRSVAGRVAALMEEARWLAGALPSLRLQDAGLMQQAEGFLELYGGVKGTTDMASLLDPKQQLEVESKLREVEQRLHQLISSAREVGAKSEEPPDTYELANSGHAEVLRLPEAEDEVTVPPLRPAPHTAGELQEDIASLRDDLKDFGSQLDNLSDMVLNKATRRPLNFAPLPRLGEQEPTALNELDEDMDTAREAADKVAALEVAKRSSWYCSPPSPLPEGCEVISVNQAIKFRPVTDLFDRPQSAQPCLLAGTRPFTAPVLSNGGRPPSSRQAVVSQRLGYPTAGEEDHSRGMQPLVSSSTCSTLGNTSGERADPSPSMPRSDGVDGGDAGVNQPDHSDHGAEAQEDHEVVEDEEISEQGRLGGEADSMPVASPGDGLAEAEVLELPDLDTDDPFCNSSVSWSVS